MSRPSSMLRIQKHISEKCENDHSHTIIGDTATSFLHANRLINNGVTSDIHILIEGPDSLDDNNIDDEDFPVKYIHEILHYLMTEQVEHLSNDKNVCVEDFESLLGSVFPYRPGKGVCGDFVGSFITPHIGPWFGDDTSSRLYKFIDKYTLRSDLSNSEKIVANYLTNYYHLDTTTSKFIVKRPTMMFAKYAFLENPPHGCTTHRQLFRSILEKILCYNNIKIYTNVKCMKFTHSDMGENLYHVMFESAQCPVEIHDSRLDFTSNPYTFIRQTSLGGLTPRQLYVPATYRAIIPINSCNPQVMGTGGTAGVNLEANCPGTTGNCGNDTYINPDMTTSHLTFSMHDGIDRCGKRISWLMHIYTTIEDTSIVAGEGKYADQGKQLLVIEGICVRNKRAFNCDPEQKETNVHLNDHCKEKYWARSFANIVSTIYFSYTGIYVDPEDISNIIPLCNSGICLDLFQWLTEVQRQLPLDLVNWMVSFLYGSDWFPKLNKFCN